MDSCKSAQRMYATDTTGASSRVRDEPSRIEVSFSWGLGFAQNSEKAVRIMLSKETNTSPLC